MWPRRPRAPEFTNSSRAGTPQRGTVEIKHLLCPALSLLTSSQGQAAPCWSQLPLSTSAPGLGQPSRNLSGMNRRTALVSGLAPNSKISGNPFWLASFLMFASGPGGFQRQFSWRPSPSPALCSSQHPSSGLRGLGEVSLPGASWLAGVGGVLLSPDVSEAAAAFRVSPADAVLGGSNASPSPKHTRVLGHQTKCLWGKHSFVRAPSSLFPLFLSSSLLSA